jgi:hypothetical protein
VNKLWNGIIEISDSFDLLIDILNELDLSATKIFRQKLIRKIVINDFLLVLFERGDFFAPNDTIDNFRNGELI